MKAKRFTAQDMAMVGVLAALVFAASWIQFTIPTAIDNTRLHLGNVMCLLSGLLLGPGLGGLAAGLGSMFFDFTNPLYINEAWITFLTKFAMAWLCGMIAKRRDESAVRRVGRDAVAATAGAMLYVALYLLKTFLMNYFFLRMELTPVLITVAQKAVVSTINGALAVVIVIPLASALRAALSRAHIGGRPAHR